MDAHHAGRLPTRESLISGPHHSLALPGDVLLTIVELHRSLTIAAAQYSRTSSFPLSSPSVRTNIPLVPCKSESQGLGIRPIICAYQLFVDGHISPCLLTLSSVPSRAHSARRPHGRSDESSGRRSRTRVGPPMASPTEPSDRRGS